MAGTTQAKRPREDDVLECYLYPRFCYSSPAGGEQVTEAMLREECRKYEAEVRSYCDGYLWHRDSLSFRPRTRQALQFDSVIEGSSAKATGEDSFCFVCECVALY